MSSVQGGSTNAINEKDEVHEENGVVFWVNRSGIPLDDRTWQRMWDHVAKIHPEGVTLTKKIRNNNNLPQVSVPQPPLNFPPTVSAYDRLERIQHYMSELEYNHTGTQFFEIKKNRPVTGLMECAKEMIREALPIKCLEAVVLGIFLTNGISGLERFPISFKSVFMGNVYRHVVLGVYHGGRYGAIGMSRREDLMYKPLEFMSLSDLVFDFEKCYTRYWHELRKVKVGLAISHDQHSYEMINWKALSLTMNRQPVKEITRQLELHSRNMRAKSRSWSINSPTKNIASLVDSVALRDSPSRSRGPSPIRVARSKSQGSDTAVSKSPVRRNGIKSGGDGDYQLRI